MTGTKNSDIVYLSKGQEPKTKKRKGGRAAKVEDMREYAREQIMEQYGAEALRKIEQAQHSGNFLLVYADDYTFEIVGGNLTNHSISVDDALDLLGVDMDAWAAEQGFDGWDWEALHLVDVE